MLFLLFNSLIEILQHKQDLMGDTVTCDSEVIVVHLRDPKVRV